MRGATRFDETNQDLCLILRALQESLRELCGGCAPFRPDASEHQDEKQQTIETTSTKDKDDGGWQLLLEETCRASISATIKGPIETNLQGKPWDVEVRTITSLFKRFTSRNSASTRSKDSNHKQPKRPKGRRTNVHKDSATPMAEITTALVLTSDFGVRRTVDSPVAWAELILPRMEDRLPRGWRGFVGPSGFLLWVSPDRATALYEIAGRRPCPSCEAWPKGGEKGLWWHQQEQHAVHHGSATACAAATRNTRAVMLYDPSLLPSTIDELLQSATQADRSHQDEKKEEHNDDQKQHRLPSIPVQCPEERRKIAFQYATDGDLERLQVAIHQGWVDPVHDVDVRGASLLLWAAGGGHVSVVKYLVEECGCDPRKPQQQYRRGFAGRTALHWACRKGYLNVVQYLLQYCGHDALEDRTADGTTAVGWAAWQGQQDILSYLFEHYQCDMLTVNKFGCNALLWAAQGTASPATMQWLVEVAKCPITHTNGNGHGILHKAAQRNKPDAAQWFQEYVSQLLLDEACTLENCKDLLKLLGPDREGCTPSDLAGIEGHEQLAIQVTECEKILWRHALDRYPEEEDLAFLYKVGVTALSDEYGPGCGVARLWDFYQTHKHKSKSS